MRNKYLKYKMAIIMVLFVSFFIEHKLSAFAQGTNALIEKKCAKCHNLKRVYYNQMSAKRWEATVNRMLSKRTGWLSGRQLSEILSYLAANNLIERKQLFEKKCFDCHERILKKKQLFLMKTKQGWKRAIERMRKKYCMFIGIDEAEEISIYWTDPENNKNLKLDETEYDRLEGVFENKCGACHSYKFLYQQKYNSSDWDEVLVRMRQKSPIILKADDLKNIKDYLLQTKSLLVK